MMKSAYCSHVRIAVLLLLALGLTPVKAGEFEVEPGYISLFNGKDLTGWGYRTK